MKKTAVAAFIFMIASAASADNESAGWRIGGALAYGDYALSDGSISDTSVGFKLFGQYRFNSLLGAEGAYYNSAEFSDDLTPNSPGGEADTSYKGWSLSGVGYVPLPGERFDLFLKAGYVDFTNVKLKIDGADFSTRSEDGLTLGLGAAIEATEILGIRLEFDWYDTTGADLWSLNLGAEYRF